MILRSQRRSERWHAHHSDAADRTTTTTLDPPGHSGHRARGRPFDQSPGTGPGVIRLHGGGGFSLLLFESGNPDGSWAACDYTPAAATEFVRVCSCAAGSPGIADVPVTLYRQISCRASSPGDGNREPSTPGAVPSPG